MLCEPLPVIFAAGTWFPNAIHDVVQLPRWLVMSFPTCPCSRNTLTLSSVPATTSKSTGSDTTSATFGTLNPGAPENVSGTTFFRSTAGELATPPSGHASATAVMGSVVVPNAFESRRRMRDVFAVM